MKHTSPCSRLVHLVDKGDSWDGVTVCLPPDDHALCLHASRAVKQGHAPIQHLQRPLNLKGKVHVSRCVYQVDAMLEPVEANGGRVDGDASLTLLLHVVHHCVSIINISHVPGEASVEEHPLARSGLACVDVRHDPHIPDQWLDSSRRRSHLSCCRQPSFPRVRNATVSELKDSPSAPRNIPVHHFLHDAQHVSSRMRAS